MSDGNSSRAALGEPASTYYDQMLTAMDQSGAAVTRVVEAYLAKRTPERDLLWLSLQAGKEFNAVRRRVLQAQETMDRVERGVSWAAFGHIIEELEEEFEHYRAYAGLLDEVLAGAPYPAEMWCYHGWEPDPLWPQHSRRVLEQREMLETAGEWGAAVLLATSEGHAVAWHYAMAQLPPTDRFLEAVREIQQGIIADELHHGLQEVERLAREAPSPAAVEAVLPLIRRVGALCVRQRNEQFDHPLSETEIAALERELLDGTIAPLHLYRQAVVAGA
jgi:hypothetical protein